MPIRIVRKRTKGWKLPPNCRCVTRPGVFGNPFKTVDDFREWLLRGHVAVHRLIRPDEFLYSLHGPRRLFDRRELILSRLPELRGWDLACWCGLDTECHADVLLELANGD